LLSARDGDGNAEAKILRTYLLLGFAQRARIKAQGIDIVKAEANERKKVDELRSLLTEYLSYSDVVATQTYQMGCDILGCFYILHCQPVEASQWFNRELDARSKQQIASDLPIWQRPPEKLRLYHMFLAKIKTLQTSVASPELPHAEDTS